MWVSFNLSLNISIQGNQYSISISIQEYQFKEPVFLNVF